MEQPEKEGVKIHSEKVTKQMGDSKNRSQDCSCKWLNESREEAGSELWRVERVTQSLKAKQNFLGCPAS